MNSLVVRGALALVLVIGVLGYYILYQQAPTALLTLASLAVGYWFGHPDAPGGPGSGTNQGAK